jgi:predicted small integral membrane protein
MTQEETGLFQVRFTDEGKKFIRKFVALSYTIIVLIIFECAILIYWEIRILATGGNERSSVLGFTPTLYDRIYPYISLSFSVLSVISNIYYVRFPQALLRSLDINDESGANRAFSLLFRGALVYLLWLILGTANLIWSLTVR